jgi:hypothetical protein
MDARQHCNEAYELYRQRPSRENGIVLCRSIATLLKNRELAVICPSVAMLEVLLDRKHTSQHWYSILAIKIGINWLRSQMADWRPGWNDYFMVRWQLTKDQRCADEIHRRAHHVGHQPNWTGKEDWGAVGYTAAWMALSQREQNPEFDEAMKIAERDCFICHPQQSVFYEGTMMRAEQ